MVETRATSTERPPAAGESEHRARVPFGRVALRDAWFPVAHTPHVRTRAIERRVHEQPVYLWREGDRIRAAEFGPAELRTRRRDASEFTGGTGEYPVLERYGYAWVWYGNPANADAALVPDIPYLPRSGKLPRHLWGTFIFHCTYELVCENLLDLTHADFLHGKVVGDSYSENDEISVESTSETVIMIREAKGRKRSIVQRLMGICTTTDTLDFRGVTFVHLRSGVTILHGHFKPRSEEEAFSVRLFHPNVPESKVRTHLPFTFNPKGANWFARNSFPQVTHIVAPQDDRMMRAQNPRYLEEEDSTDVSSRFDAAGLMYRKRMRQLVERQMAGDFSYRSDCDPGADISKLMGVDRVSG